MPANATATRLHAPAAGYRAESLQILFGEAES